MKFVIVKGRKGWHGATDDDEVNYRKSQRRMTSAKPGKWMRVEVTTMREGWMHRKFFALLNLIKENSEVFDTIEKALVAVKLVIGHFDLVVDPTTGEITKQVRSISYDNMDQTNFEVFYVQAIDGVLQHILPQMDRETADQLLEHIVEGWVER